MCRCTLTHNVLDVVQQVERANPLANNFAARGNQRCPQYLQVLLPTRLVDFSPAKRQGDEGALGRLRKVDTFPRADRVHAQQDFRPEGLERAPT